MAHTFSEEMKDAFIVITLNYLLSGKEDELATLVLVFAMLGKAAGLSGNYNVQIYSAELFPTVVR